MGELGSGTVGRRRARGLASAALCLVVALAGGCAPEAGSTLSTSTTTTTTSSTTSSAGSDEGAGTGTGTDTASYEVDSLGLRFDLPASYSAVETEDVEFLARSDSPASIFSIDRGDAGATTFDPEPGESVTTSPWATRRRSS